MIRYFRELLYTLKAALFVLKEIEKHLKLISSCVKTNHHDHGDKASMSTKHWND